MIKVKSFAKINLYLNIVRKRIDGYHDIDTLFQTVSVHDTLRFEEVSDSENGLIIESNIPDLKDKDNLIFKAYDKLKPFIQNKVKTVKVNLEKVIPSGAGLGGGSSNAAVTLIALNQIFDLNIEYNKLLEIGASLGADVPFFIQGGLARGEGIGEKLCYLEDKELSLPLLIVYPMIHASTKEAYQGLNLELANKPSIDVILNAIKDKDPKLIADGLYNQFEESQFKVYTELIQVKRDLLSSGALGALMSGSGSSFFGIFDDNKKLDQAFEFFKGKDYKVFKAETLNSQEYKKQLNIEV